jgi:hypothetical protein
MGYAASVSTPTILERLESPAPDLCFYGLAPPKQSTEPERLSAILQAQKARISALTPDALIVYDLQDESDRQTRERPFPFFPTLSPLHYAHDLLGELTLPKIVYRCVGQDTPESLTSWIEALRRSGGPHLSVFVGAATSRPSARAGSLSLADAYALARPHGTSLAVGGIAIAERHARRGDEHLRLLQKAEAGCRFFVTQAVYDASATKSLLSDYARELRARGQRPVPIIFTFSPCGSARTLELLKWLGIAIPRWLENELLETRDILGASVRACQIAWDDVLSYARSKDLPVGVNVESVSIRKEEVEAAGSLFTALRTRFRRPG